MNLIKLINNKLKENNYIDVSIFINELFNKNIKFFDIYNNNLNIFRTIVISILFFLLIIFFNIDNNFSKIKLKKEISYLEEYYKICNAGILLNKTKIFKNIQNPKISIISSLYNKEKFILRFLRSIQNQNFDEIEIILIDDFSEDNTVNIIENLQKYDERIILIKNKKNKGTLISRNEGIFISKGKYLIIPDGDDILSKNLLNKCFIIAEKNKYDMIRFNTYLGKRNIFMYDKIKYIINKEIYQPQLSSYIFYKGDNLEITDPMISNKFIKRNIVINTLNFINDYFLNQNMIFYEDTLINYILYKMANSFYFIKDLGYYYISNSNSSTIGYKQNEKSINRVIYSFFLFLKFIFLYTKNNKYEKEMANAFIKKENKVILTPEMCYNINNNFDFYKRIIDLYITNKFIPLMAKKRLRIVKQIIKQRENFYS